MPSQLSLWLLHGVPAFPIDHNELQAIRKNITRTTAELDYCRLRLENDPQGLDSPPLDVKARIKKHLDSVTPDIIRIREALRAVNDLGKRNAREDKIFHRLRHMQLIIVTMILGLELWIMSGSYSAWVLAKLVPVSVFALNLAHLYPVGGEDFEYLEYLHKSLSRRFFVETLLNSASLILYACNHEFRFIVLAVTYACLFVGVWYVNKLRFVEVLKAAQDT